MEHARHPAEEERAAAATAGSGMTASLKDTLLGVVLLSLFAVLLLCAVLLLEGYRLGRWLGRVGRCKAAGS